MSVTIQHSGGALGFIPVVTLYSAKPRLRNNGYACYSGQGPIQSAELRNALIECDKRNGYDGKPHGHCRIQYRNGDFLAYASDDNSGTAKIVFW